MLRPTTADSSSATASAVSFAVGQHRGPLPVAHQRRAEGAESHRLGHPVGRCPQEEQALVVRVVVDDLEFRRHRGADERHRLGAVTPVVLGQRQAEAVATHEAAARPGPAEPARPPHATGR